jgi:hypothetical protein
MSLTFVAGGVAGAEAGDDAVVAATAPLFSCISYQCISKIRDVLGSGPHSIEIVDACLNQIRCYVYFIGNTDRISQNRTTQEKKEKTPLNDCCFFSFSKLGFSFHSSFEL